jgi:DNA-binding Lrp family transcriptional regulator
VQRYRFYLKLFQEPIALFQIILSEAYVLLNVNYKKQSAVIDQINQISTVKAVKSVYGIYDLVIIFESDNLQQVKSEIDEKFPLVDGIENMTTLISVS